MNRTTIIIFVVTLIFCLAVLGMVVWWFRGTEPISIDVITPEEFELLSPSQQRRETLKLIENEDVNDTPEERQEVFRTLEAISNDSSDSEAENVANQQEIIPEQGAAQFAPGFSAETQVDEQTQQRLNALEAIAQ